MDKDDCKCVGCPVYKYCGTMVSSIRLCRSIHKEDGRRKEKLK